jgi:hypothetical protein
MASAPLLAENGLVQAAITPTLVNPRLDSWKQIAAFFSRNIRTVQRWERTEGLPIYRHIHERFGSIYTFEAELVAWRANRSPHAENGIANRRTSHYRLRLAVLPFANLSGEPEFGVFGTV